MSSYLSNQQKLHSGDELVSTNGLFKLTLQPDGNLVATAAGYAYWSTDTPTAGNNVALEMRSGGDIVLVDHAGKSLWTSNNFNGTYHNDSCLMLLNDGNLQIRTYLNSPDVLWSSNRYFSFTPSNIRNVKFNSPVLNHVATLGSHKVEATNGLSEEATVTQAISIAVTDTSMWEASMGVTLSASTSITCGLPVLAEGTVELGVEVSTSYTLGKQVSETNTVQADIAVPVPAKGTVKGYAIVTQQEFSAGYTAVADYVFISESKKNINLPGPFKGVYHGGNGYSIHFVLTS